MHLLIGMMVGAFIGLIMQIVFALSLALPIVAATLSAHKQHRVPMYWILALASTCALGFAYLWGYEPITAESVNHSYMAALEATYTSWPFLTTVIGSPIALALSYSNRPEISSLSGSSWGALSISVIHYMLNPLPTP